MSPGWGSTPDPVFLKWHRVPNGLESQYTKLRANQSIILVNICILEVTHVFAIFQQVQINAISQKIDIFAQRKR